MAILEFLGVAGLGAFIGLLIVKVGSNQKQQRELDTAFYRILAAQAGKISLIQLAAMAQVSAEIAQEYLDKQVQVFSAFPEVDEDGNTYYQFPKLNLPKSMTQDW